MDMDELSINSDVTVRLGAAAALGCIDQYELLKELGGGGFGTVYLAKDTVSGVDVAVKGLPPFVKNNREEMENIRANFALVSRLHHPNIAAALVLHLAKSVTYASEDVRQKLRVLPGDTLMVMEYAPGVTLSQWRKQFPERRVPIDKALEITRQIASALDYAHERKIIHRDIKPANVMIETAADGSVTARVLDFGLAAEIRSSMGRVSQEIHDTAGTRPYMAPEQWLGYKQGSETDQYALAVLFNELVTGEVPFASVFDTGDPVVMMNVVGSRPFAPPSNLPKPMRRALSRALAKKPEERFTSCGDFVAALVGHGFSRKGRKGRKGWGVWKVILAMLVLGFAAAGGWWWMNHTPSPLRGTPPNLGGELENSPSSSAAAHNSPSKIEGVATKPLGAYDNGTEPPEDAERKAREAQTRAAEYMRLKTRINIKVSDAKEKMERINALRADSDGLAAHIESADSQWKTLSALGAPNSLEEAKAAFDIADKAEAQIALDLDWLTRNKSGRDAAKTAEKEIDALLTGDIATFKAELYAAKSLGDGKSLQAKGKEAFGSGDFAEAGRLLGEAKAKFAAAAKEAKSFYIGTTLESAREYANGAKWQDCIAVCEKVLGWDSSNAEANRLKEDAQSHLVPSLRLVAKINGREVDGAKVRIDDKDYSTPMKWDRLNDGAKIGPYKVAYESGGRRYYGTFDSVMVDWRGPKVIPVALKEYTGPKHGDTKTITLPGGATMEMIYCAPGNYVYGYDNTTMRMDHGFWLGKYEVTQKQWQSVMRENPSKFKGENLPVERVSWNDCQEFCQKVNAQLNCGARLPNEHEWEYACRAGTRTTYSWGDVLNGTQANCNGNYPEGTSTKGPYMERTTAVGTYEARGRNDWGFCDMHGNVWEWCEDNYGASGTNRVLRGGGWGNNARYCRSARRDGFNPGYRYSYLGFRLCCSAGPRE